MESRTKMMEKRVEEIETEEENDGKEGEGQEDRRMESQRAGVVCIIRNAMCIDRQINR